MKDIDSDLAKESIQNKIDGTIERLEKHVEKADKASEYSIVRFDLLVISLSTGALLLSINYTRGITDHSHIGYLKFSWLVFVVCIVSNLLSQVTGYFANTRDISATRNIIREKKNKPLKGNQELLEVWCKRFKMTTLWLNLLSLITFICGIISLIVYFSNNI